MIKIAPALLIGLVGALCVGDIRGEDIANRGWQCTSRGFERRIESYKRDRATLEGEFACWVVYTKDGESEVLWQAKNNPDYCEPRAIALVEKLQGAGFKCLASDPAAEPEQRDDGPQAATDDTDDMVPADLDDTDDMVPADLDDTDDVVPADLGDTDDAIPSVPQSKNEEKPGSQGKPENTTAEYRTLLEKHYVGSYLDAMLAAVPQAFSVQPGMDALSPGRGEYLHVAPPNNFVKTMSDGSYVLVNTMLFERGATSSYVNFGFQVHDKRFRFLGYAPTQPVTDIKVLDADSDKVVVSLMPVASASCAPSRRTEVITWHDGVYGRYGSEPGQTTGEARNSDCGD